MQYPVRRNSVRINPSDCFLLLQKSYLFYCLNFNFYTDEIIFWEQSEFTAIPFHICCDILYHSLSYNVSIKCDDNYIPLFSYVPTTDSFPILWNHMNKNRGVFALVMKT